MAKEESWEKIERQAWDFKENPELVGVLKDKVDSQFSGHDYILEKDDKEILVFGKTALQAKLEAIALGTKVKLVFIGIKKSEKSGREYEDYEVFKGK